MLEDTHNPLGTQNGNLAFALVNFGPHGSVLESTINENFRNACIKDLCLEHPLDIPETENILPLKVGE